MTIRLTPCGAAGSALLAVAFCAAASGCLAQAAAPAPGSVSPPMAGRVGLRAPSSPTPLTVSPDTAGGLDLTVSTPPARQPVSLTRGERMKRAFATELRDVSIRDRRAGLYGNIPDAFPQLLEDSLIERRQAELAESVLGRAVEAALTEGFFAGRRHESRMGIRPAFAVVDHGLRVDASPSWSYRVTGPHGGFRVEVPLTPSGIRMHAFRDLKGTDRTPLRMGAGLVIDPFDEEVRAGISFQF